MRARLASIALVLSIATSLTAAPIWMRRSESLLAVNGEECLARAFRAFRAEGLQPTQNMTNGVWGSKGARWTLIVCNPAPGSQTWANIVSAAPEAEADAHYADHERVGARMGEASTAPVRTTGQLLTARADARGYGIVNWSNAPTSAGTWVSIVPVGTGDGQHVGRWAYTNGVASGQYESGPLSPGRYEARFYGDSGYGTVLARVTFEVIAQTTSFLSVDVNGRIAAVVWSNAPTTSGAWVSVVPVGTPDGQHTGRWVYTNATGSGRYEGPALEPGEYEARFYADSGYGKIVSRARFVIR